MSESRVGTDPDADGPETGFPDDADEVSNPEAVRLFVRLVVVFDVALLALALGPMFVFFRGERELGTQIFLAGVVAFGYGTYRYYAYRHGSDDVSERNG